MKKLKFYILPIIFIIFILNIFTNLNVIFAMNYSEDKIYCEATLSDEFADDKVLLVLNDEASLSTKEYTVTDFINIRCTEVNELTINDKAKRVLSLQLENSSKSYVLEVIEKLIQRNDVFYAGPDYKIALSSPTSNGYGDLQQWAITDLELQSAWNFTTGSNEVVVGILDTGIDETHPDLENSIIKSMCKKFVEEKVLDYDLWDQVGHGTSCAGIIGAIGDNDIGCVGINWNVSLVSLKVTDNRSSGFASSVAKAIGYAEENNIRILNLSINWYEGYEMFDVALDEIINSYSGLLICGAGNEGIDNDGTNSSFPSGYSSENIISVGAYDEDHKRAIWNLSESSNYGITSVDIYAPGNNIYTTTINAGYKDAYGTSAAAPHVTGVAALLLSLNKDLTAAQLKEAILNSADTIIINVPDTSITAESDDTISQEVLKLNGYNAVKYVLEHFSNIEYNLSDSNYFINTNNTITSDESYFNSRNVFYKLNIDVTRDYEFEIVSDKNINVILYDEDFENIEYIDLDNLNTRTYFMKNLIEGTYYLRVYYEDINNSGIINTSIRKYCEGCNLNYNDRVILNCKTEPYEDSLYLQQNQTIIYELDLECDTRYDFEVESPNLLSVGLYDDNMILVANFLYFQGSNNNYYYFNIQDLERGIYHIKIKLENESVSCNINVSLDHRPTSTEEILVNESVDVLEHLHYNNNVYYFMRNKPGIYEVVLTGTSSNGTIYYPEGTITIIRGDDVVQKYVFSKEEYDNPANSLNGSNTMTWLVDDYASYYINIDINSTGLTSLQLEVRELEIFTLSASDEYSETSSLINGDKFEILDVERTGEYNVQAIYTGSQTDDMLFVILRKNSDGLFEEVDGGLFNNTTNFETDVLLNTGEQIYVGYFNGNGNGTFSLNIERNVSNTFSLMTDPNGNVTVGSEVSLNNGEYGGTTLTQGYTRIVYLGIDAPYIQSRTQYNWYTTDSSVAIVSSYGTVTATATWTGSQAYKTVVIRAVYKSNPTIVGEITLTVYKDTNTAIEVLAQYGMDVRGDGSQGTEVTVLHESPISIGVMPDVEIHKGYTRYVCLGDDSPNPSIQAFEWRVIREEGDTGMVTVSSYGTITATTYGRVIVEGTYKYNTRFKVRIVINVV